MLRRNNKYNKRLLYESIMKDVSKILKRKLTEEKTEVEIAADTLINDLKKHRKDLQFAIGFMKILSKGRESKTTYKNVSYDKLIPELEKRLKSDKSLNDSKI